MTTSRSKFVLASAAATVFLSATHGSAATRTWDAEGGNAFWGTPENWSDNTAPTDPVPSDAGQGDIASFPSLSSITHLPLFNAVNAGDDAVKGLVIVNNPGGVVWTFDRPATVNDRGLSLGSSGITLSGGGTTAMNPQFLRLTADQTWNVGADTRMETFVAGNKSVISGAFKVTKTGAGTVATSANSGSWTGGLDITGGTFANNFSTNGAGVGPVNVFDGGTYQALNSTNSGAVVTLHDGAVLQGSGSGAGLGGTNTLVISGDVQTEGVIINTTGVSGDVFTINSTTPFQGGHANSVITFSAPNDTMIVVNGTGAGYLGTFQQTAGTLRLGNTVNVLAARPLTMSGGTKLSLGSLGATGVNDLDMPITIAGDATIEADRPTSSTSAPSSSFDFSQVLTTSVPVSGTRKLSIVRGANITSTGTPLVKFNGGIALKGDLELETGAFTSVNPGAIVNAVGSVGAFNLIKSGAGTLTGNTTNTYTGTTTIQGGTLIFGVTSGIGASTGYNIEAGTLRLDNGTATSSNVDHTLSRTGGAPIPTITGDGAIQAGNGGANRTVVIAGSSAGVTVMTPGNDGDAGILDIIGSFKATTANSVWPDLVINVTGTEAVAGTDYARLAVSQAVSQWSNIDLIINLASLDPTLMQGDVLDIITGTADFSTANFHSIVVNGGTADVIRGTNVVQLQNIVPIPEPTALAAVALAGMGMMARRRRMA